MLKAIIAVPVPDPPPGYRLCRFNAASTAPFHDAGAMDMAALLAGRVLVLDRARLMVNQMPPPGMPFLLPHSATRQ